MGLKIVWSLNVPQCSIYFPILSINSLRLWQSSTFKPTGPGVGGGHGKGADWLAGLQQSLFLFFYSGGPTRAGGHGRGAVCASVCLSRSWNPYHFLNCPPKLEGPKTIQHLNHTLLLLYLPSPESWVSTNPGPKSQRPSFKLLTGVPTVKKPNSKKTWRRPGGAQVCGIAGISIKPGRWRSLVSPRRPASRAINQAFCHKWTGKRPVCFRGCRWRWPEYPSSVVSLLSLCSSRREGASGSGALQHRGRCLHTANVVSVCLCVRHRHSRIATKAAAAGGRARCHDLLYIQCGCVMEFGAKRCAQRARRGVHRARWAGQTGLGNTHKTCRGASQCPKVTGTH